jgi:hypothetical protein
VTAFRLASVAPRLAKARDERVLELRAEAWARRRRMRQELALDRLIAHRELQLVRAYGTGNARYIRARERKLAEARCRRRILDEAA